jgi:hypothetical protein
MRIVILTHQRESRPIDLYVLGLLAEHWRDAGHHVDVLRGIRHRPNADLAIAHVDLTHVPAEYADFVRSYPRAWNDRVIDISKRTISRQLVTRDDDWRGPVIVKTDLNSRGAREIALLGAMTKRDPWQLLPRAISRRLRYRMMGPDSPFRKYQILPSQSDVPDRVWRDSRLVVERFLPEREGDDYVMRTAFFVGSVGINTSFRSDDPIARGGSVRDPQEHEMLAELVALRNELELDYGRIDYAIVDGKAVVWDVNKTPSVRARTERASWMAAQLAAGLDAP